MELSEDAVRAAGFAGRRNSRDGGCYDLYYARACHLAPHPPVTSYSTAISGLRRMALTVDQSNALSSFRHVARQVRESSIVDRAQTVRIRHVAEAGGTAIETGHLLENEPLRAVSLGVGRGDADSAVRTIHHALFSRVPSDALHA